MCADEIFELASQTSLPYYHTFHRKSLAPQDGACSDQVRESLPLFQTPDTQDQISYPAPFIFRRDKFVYIQPMICDMNLSGDVFAGLPDQPLLAQLRASGYENSLVEFLREQQLILPNVVGMSRETIRYFCQQRHHARDGGRLGSEVRVQRAMHIRIRYGYRY